MAIFDDWRDIIARDLNWNNGTNRTSWSERTLDKFGVYDFATQGKPMLTDQVQTFKEGGRQIAKSWKAAGEERAGFGGDDIVRGINQLGTAAGQQLINLDQHAQKNILDVNGSAEQAAWLVGNVMRGANYASEKTGDAAGWLAKTTGVVDEDAAKFLGGFIPDLALAGAGKAGLLTKGAKSLNRASKAALGEDLLGAVRRANIPKKGIIRKGIDDVVGGIQDATAPVGVTDTGMLAKIPVEEMTLAQRAAQPLYSMADTRFVGWQGKVKTALKRGADSNEIGNILNTPVAKQLAKKHTVHTAKDLANNPELLGQLISRADYIDETMAKFRKYQSRGQKPPGNFQRNFYDTISRPPDYFNPSKLAYNQKLFRETIERQFKELMGEHWHHVFGNKESAEMFLTWAAQDPVISANLYEKLIKLKMEAGGGVINMSSIPIKGHVGSKGIHVSFLQKEGFESASRFKKGILDFSDYARELDVAIANGTADINQLFEMLEVYSKRVQPLMKKKIQEYGGRMLSDYTAQMKP